MLIGPRLSPSDFIFVGARGEPGNEAREQVLQSYRSKHVMRFITRFALQRRECATCGIRLNLVLKESKPISRDSDLEELISTYTEQIPPTDEVITAHDVIKTVVRVGTYCAKSKQYCCLVFATFL